MKKLFFALIGIPFVFLSCNKDYDESNPTEVAMLKFTIKLDSTQERLDNIGQPSQIPTGHSAQSPKYNGFSAHYIELSPNAYTPLGEGEIVYMGESSYLGGDTAIDFNKAIIVNDNELFFEIPLSQVKAGTYEYIRVSLSYQNYDILLKINNPITLTVNTTIASFVGYNTYISSFPIKDSLLTVNDSKKQGFWAMETPFGVFSGQAPEGATTVPNPIFNSSPIPQGSCVVTGPFVPGSLEIPENPVEDINITLSISTNKSFEWKDQDMDGYYEPADGDTVVDMGLRGLIPIVE